jgi:flagellar motor switch protein FliN/FliY
MTGTDNHTDQPDNTDDDWAAAMAEQASADTGGDSAADSSDDWAQAMAEQAAQPQAVQAEPDADSRDPSSRTASGASLFQPLSGEAGASAPRDLDMIMEIPVTLTVELGKTRLTIRELLDLAKGSIVELNGLAGEPMDILINGYLLAQGEVVVVDDKYGIRITDIVTRAERVHKLNQ